MAKRADRLLAQIEQDVLDESKPLASALRKCVILGGHAGSADLREWATRELQGYRSEDDKLPDYRYIAAPLLVDGISGHWKITGEEISVLDLPEIARDVVKDDMEMRLGIGEIEAMIRQAEAKDGFVRLGMPGGAELARMMTHELGNPYRGVSRIYRSVAAASLRGVVDAVRTALAELVGELRAGMPEDAQVPSTELADQALQVAVHGSKNRISVSAAQASGESTAAVAPQEPEKRGFWTTSRRTGALIVGLATVAGAVAAILALHPKF